MSDSPESDNQSGAGTGADAGSASASSADAEYRSLLDSGGGVMGTIRIPKISVRLPIYHGTSESALASGAGHLYGSSLPVGGKSTHAILTRHDFQLGRVVGLVATQAVAYSQACCLVAEARLIRLLHEGVSDMQFEYKSCGWRIEHA